MLTTLVATPALGHSGAIGARKADICSDLNGFSRQSRDAFAIVTGGRPGIGSGHRPSRLARSGPRSWSAVAGSVAGDRWQPTLREHGRAALALALRRGRRGGRWTRPWPRTVEELGRIDMPRKNNAGLPDRAPLEDFTARSGKPWCRRIHRRLLFSQPRGRE